MHLTPGHSPASFPPCRPTTTHEPLLSLSRFNANSPPPFRSGCLLLADVRSPAHRCFSSFLSFLRRQRQSKVSRRAPSTPPTPPQLTTANLPVGGKEDAAVELVLVWRWATINVSGVKEAFLTACLGSALDVDHFLAAGSLQLSEAAGLARKPWGHSIAALVSAVRGAFVSFGGGMGLCVLRFCRVFFFVYHT